MVTDEDSTTRSKLSHSRSELFAAGKITDAERQYPPKKEGNLGTKMPGHGELELDHPPIDDNELSRDKVNAVVEHDDIKLWDIVMRMLLLLAFILW